MKAGRQQSHVQQLARGPRRRPPWHLSRGVRSHSRAPAGPTCMGTGLALPMGRPGGKAIHTRSITETPRPPRGMPEGRQLHRATKGAPASSIGTMSRAWTRAGKLAQRDHQRHARRLSGPQR